MSGGSARAALLARAVLGSDEDVEQHAIKLSADELNRVVAQIGRLTRTASLEFALRVGALIVHHFYSGNTDTWRLRGPKTSSFRRLAEHPNLPMSPGALYRCVAIFELCDRLGAPSRWSNLGASHLRVVLGIDTTAQERLLAQANSERWTVRVLQDQVEKSKLARRARGGRRPQSRATRFVRTIRKCLSEHQIALHDVESVDPIELSEIASVLEEARASLESMALALLNAQNDSEPESGKISIECVGFEAH